MLIHDVSIPNTKMNISAILAAHSSNYISIGFGVLVIIFFLYFIIF